MMTVQVKLGIFTIIVMVEDHRSDRFWTTLRLFLVVDDIPDGRTMHFVRTPPECQRRDVKAGSEVIRWRAGIVSPLTYRKDGTLKITVSKPPQWSNPCTH